MNAIPPDRSRSGKADRPPRTFARKPAWRMNAIPPDRSRSGKAKRPPRTFARKARVAYERKSSGSFAIRQGQAAAAHVCA